MDKLGAIAERLLTSFVLSVGLMLVSFSVMTQKFPPAKEDISKAFNLIKSMYGSAAEVSQSGEALQNSLGPDGTFNIHQLAEFQRLSLKRTEMTLELMDLFPRIPQGVSDPVIQERLLRINQNMGQVDQDLGEVSKRIQSFTK
ncbi:MAG: hypothetical protein ACK5P6_05795 [Pseudobdellovibrionaceae bacterium]|jgi:hypothetical protein